MSSEILSKKEEISELVMLLNLTKVMFLGGIWKQDHLFLEYLKYKILTVKTASKFSFVVNIMEEDN